MTFAVAMTALLRCVSQVLAERSRLFDILLEAAFDQDETTTHVSLGRTERV